MWITLGQIPLHLGWIGWCDENLGFMALKRRPAIPAFPNDSGCIIIVLLGTGQDLRGGLIQTKWEVCIIDSCVPWVSHTLSSWIHPLLPLYVWKTSFINLDDFASSGVSYSLMSMVLGKVYSQLIRIWFKQTKSLYLYISQRVPNLHKSFMNSV
jgi:hypothetical protein